MFENVCSIAGSVQLPSFTPYDLFIVVQHVALHLKHL